MSEVLSLKELERKAWRSVFQDGLYDLWLGWLLLHMGVVYLISQVETTVLERTALNLGIYILSCLALWAGKRFITVPRIGRVKFSPKRRSRLMKLGVITFTAVTVTFGFTLLAVILKSSPSEDSLWQYLLPVAISLLFLIFFSLAAYYLEYERLYIIAGMFALPEILLLLFNELWGIHIGFLAWALPASVVLLMGLITLLRFHRDYPVLEIPTGELTNDER